MMAFGFHLRTDNDQSVVQEVGKIEEFVVDDQFAGIDARHIQDFIDQ